LGLITALLELGLGDGVGDDSGAGLDMTLRPAHEERADGDAGVQISGEVGIKNGAAVDAPACRLELFNNLHSADLGGTGEGSGGEAGAEGIEGGELWAKLAFESADQMHDVRVAFHEHQVLDLNGAEVRDAAEVVTAEIDEHDVLGDLFGVGAQIGFERAIGGLILMSRARSGYRPVLDIAAFDADKELRGGANDVAGDAPVAVAVVERETEEVHIGGGVHDAQGAVDFEGVDGGCAIEALRKNALEDVAGGDVVLDLVHGAEEVRTGGARDQIERSGGAPRAGGKWAREESLESIETSAGLVVKGIGGSAGIAGEIGRDDEVDLLLDVVEGEHLVEEHQVCVWHVEIIGGERGKPLDLSDDVIRKEADGSGGKGRQTGQASGRMRGELALELGKDIAFEVTCVGGGRVREGLPARRESLVGLDADEGVAANALAAFDRFEQEGFGLLRIDVLGMPCEAQKGAHRGLEIGNDRAVNRDEGVVLGQGAEVLRSRKRRVRHDPFSLLCERAGQMREKAGEPATAEERVHRRPVSPTPPASLSTTAPVIAAGGPGDVVSGDQAKQGRFSHAWRAMRHRNFRLFFVGQGVSLMGTWMTRLAMSWLTYRLTGSALLLGLVGFSGQIGTALLSPFAGVWVDRWDKRRLLVWTQILSAAQSLVLAWLTLSGRITIHEVIGLAAVQGLIDAFDMPARQSFMIQMVGRSKEDLGNGIALNSSMVNAARLVGPAAAGFLIAKVGEGYCFLFDGVSYVAVIASLVAMHVEAMKPRTGAKESVAKQMADGWAYVSGFLPVRTILLLFAACSFLGLPFLTLLPIFSTQVLHGGAHTLGLLTAANGLGALGSAAVLAMRKSVRGLTRTIAFSAAMFGAGLVVFGLSHALWLSVLAMLLNGFGMMQVMAASNTVLQTIIPEERRGRVMGWFVLAFAGTMPFGSLAAGWLAHTIGAPRGVLLTGCGVLLAAGWYAGRLPTLRRDLLPVYRELGLVGDGVAERSVTAR